ncbi:non-hydrolyzing UDP-N-acetylglucosamine 2-epimerase [Fodinicurvata sediminis]|uniref:non-hydrolyzing UDP-N-acetylglucosamine 2-epimerase n=1 Tax=Fodinicurvata sediminis TaxID=1121832 RepID=UPI0003B2F55E|nr:UDP-N-acetylglucosamine 2-epimerase (non-hydrolyzing) [Fodinicurvata sediminis]
MKKAVLFVLGTRPEAIKLAPVIRALKEQNLADITVRVCSTGQHREMLAPVLELFDIRPDYDLDIMRKDQSPARSLARAIKALDVVLNEDRPDHVVVQGDTTSSLAGALAAFYNRIPVSHVEAGLRTGNLAAPFPEEGNRQIISRVTDLHFAPTAQNRRALIEEGVNAQRIHVTGNPVIDSLLQLEQHWRRSPAVKLDLARDLQARLGQHPDHPFILVTGHRRENMGQGFRNLAQALNRIAVHHPKIPILFPWHPNPRVRADLSEELEIWPSIKLCSPLPYTDFVYTLSRASIVLTDSGGVQEEAPAFAKPVLVLRETTERQEAVEAGTVKLVGTRPETILAEVNKLLQQPDYYRSMAKAANPYGDGKAAVRIADIIQQSFGPVQGEAALVG